MRATSRNDAVRDAAIDARRRVRDGAAPHKIWTLMLASALAGDLTLPSVSGVRCGGLAVDWPAGLGPILGAADSHVHLGGL